jgi:2-polyprenyl-3-methyl-5-hydroxy-6-metoxy-1,4-benzoquinol methylase
MQIAGGQKENGVVIGNTFDKYGSRNPIVRWMMSGFEVALASLVAKAAPQSIHEVGCGEGYWVCQWIKHGLSARGSDFSVQIIELARKNAESQGLSPSIFQTGSIYDLDAKKDSADLLVCCEVFEHLEDPCAAMQVLKKVVGKYLIISVPREPLWRILNLARLKYVAQLGNTPGHVQHWSRSRFIKFVSTYFTIVEIRSPLPWTMLLCRPRA